MKVIETHSMYIVTGAPISQQALFEARCKFIEKMGYGHNLELRLGGKALSDMLLEVGIREMPAVFTNERIQGMLIIPDGSLQPDEWMVGRSNKRVREVSA